MTTTSSDMIWGPPKDGASITRWPQRLQVGWLLLAIFMISFAVAASVAAIADAGRETSSTVAGSIGMAVLFATLSLLSITIAGFRLIGLSRRIKRCLSPQGEGIQIPTGRFMLLLIISMLGVCGVYGLTTSMALHSGVGEKLMPAGRDASHAALYMAILGGAALAIAILLLTCRTFTVLRIYPTGVERYTRRRRIFLLKTFDTFLPWDDITAVIADDMVVNSGGSQVHHPMIKLQTREPLPPEMLLKFDSEDAITVMAKLFVVEPNTLLYLLRFLKDNPDQRGIVARPDAPQLLTPPPLFERFRAARALKKTARLEISNV